MQLGEVLPEQNGRYWRRFTAFPAIAHVVVLCHCSAGVGRTGTFFAVWTLLEKNSSNVLDVVQKLRRQRHPQMVQTKDQYKFIYACLVTCMSMDQSGAHF